MATHTEAKPAGTPTWIDLTTPDLDAARAFYQALFGWEYDIAGPEYGGYTTARIGGRQVTGLSAPQPHVPPMPAAWSTYFASTSVAADVERAVALGATVVVPPMEVAPFGSMAFCADPTGAVFGFWQADQHIGSELTDAAGAPCWYELYSANAVQARDFYAALLGATAEPTPDGPDYYVLKHGETMIAGVMQIDPAWGPMQPHWVTYFGVPNAETAVATATAHGGTALGGIDPSPWGRLAALQDPAGAIFKVIEVPAE